MGIPIKTAEEIEIMKKGGRRLAWVMREVLRRIEPGVRLRELEQLAGALIKKQRGRASFKMVDGYHWSTCLNVNQGVVHGVPGDYHLKKGDLVSLDMGMFYQGLHTDMARTLQVGNLKSERRNSKDKFLEAGKRALEAAIEAAKPGNRVGHISAAIEKEIKKAGFSPIEALTGHGVGKKLHEEPPIPCFLKGKIKETPELRPGMTLAIEIIYAQGDPEVILKDDGWTVETADGQLAGLFEETVAVTKEKPLVLTWCPMVEFSL